MSKTIESLAEMVKLVEGIKSSLRRVGDIAQESNICWYVGIGEGFVDNLNRSEEHIDLLIIEVVRQKTKEETSWK